MADPYQNLATRGAYFCDWPHTRLRVVGNDAAKFLHNMCTADILRLEEHECCEAFFTNVKGHILTHAWISRRESSIVVQLFQTEASALVSHLQKYIISEDVQIEPEPVCYVLLVGPAELPNIETASNVETFELIRQPCWIVETDGTQAALVTELEAIGYQAGSPELLETLRIEAPWPLAGVDFADATLPQELDRNAQAISFTKGCYLGQETIARLDALGHVNKSMVQLQFTGDALPPLGLQLTYEDKSVGNLTSVTWSPNHNAPLGLAMIRRPANEPGKKLLSEFGLATVTEKP